MKGKKILNFSIIAISFTVLMFAFVAVAPALAAHTPPGTIFVDDDNCPNTGTGTSGDPFCDIQDAVAHASAGDTIEVDDGTYGKVNIPTGKVGLTLKSASDPVIDCGATTTGGASVGNGITIGSNGVTVQGFEIRFCDNGIRLTSIADTLIRNNDIHDNKNPSTGFQGVGILFSGDSDRNTVSKNKIFDNDRQGIFLGGSCNPSAINSEQNVIRDNKISDNGQDLTAGDPANTRGPDASQYGIQLCEADNNVIIDNKVTGHNEWSFGIGIYLFDSNNNLVAQNELEDNRQGVVMFGAATNNVIIKNKIKDGIAPTCALPTCFPDISDKPATGIRIFDSASSGNTIAKNDIKDNAGWGVDVKDGNTIADNKAKGNGFGGYVIKGSGNTITENKAEESPNTKPGFMATASSSGNIFVKNKAKENTGDGFIALSSSSGNLYVENKSEDNTGFGFNDNTGATAATVANTYIANECKDNTAGSDPTGLCSPQT